jgi:hypothetical protein
MEDVSATKLPGGQKRSEESFHENILQCPSHKLRLPHPETPILLLILSTRNNQIRPLQPTLSLQLFSETRKHVLLVFSSPPLLEDLNEHQIVCPLETKPRVFADDFAWLVLRYDLVADLISFLGTTNRRFIRGVARITWYRSLGGALNFCNITFWIVSASVRSWAGERLPLITSILTRGIVLVRWG